MLRIVVATVLLSWPLSSGAQTYSRTQTTISGYNYQNLETSRASLGAQAPATHAGSPDGEQCLTQKKTGKIECHTYAEWVEIARKIGVNRQ